jgi:nicotinate-nucleotide--dimethylbenzimidazole phosphoribosyltransferase
VAEDARAAARRIVEEVLAAHEAADPPAVEAPAPGTDPASDPGSGPGPAPDPAPAVVRPETAAPRPVSGPAEPTPPAGLDPRPDPAAMPGPPPHPEEDPDAPSSAAVARRIVEEVLAAHAAAAREVELPAPAAEAEGPPPAPEAVPVQPVPGRVAVVPGVAAPAAPAVPSGLEPDPGPSQVADDAASIARRIVQSVLADAAARPAGTADPAVGSPGTAPVVSEAAPELVDLTRDELPTVVDDPEGDVADDGDVTRGAVEDADVDDTVLFALQPDDGPPPLPVEAVAVEDADGTLVLPAAGEDASDTTDAIPVSADDPLDDADRSAPEDADATAALRADDLDGSDDASSTEVLPVDRSEPLEPAPDADDGRVVATLPPRTDASAEVTTPVRIAGSSAKRSHWLLASVLGAIGLAVLLPLAIAALRSLVSLS